MYQLYTYPNCDKCSQVKEILGEKKIPYDEINLGLSEGKRIFGKIYLQVCDKLKRDDNKMAILPILIRRNDSGIEEIAQGEDIKVSLGK